MPEFYQFRTTIQIKLLPFQIIVFINYVKCFPPTKDNPDFISAKLEIRKARPDHEGEYKCNHGYQNKFMLHIASSNIDGKSYPQHHHHHNANNQPGTGGGSGGKHGLNNGGGNSDDNISHSENRSTIEQHKSKTKHDKKNENGSSSLSSSSVGRFDVEQFHNFDGGHFGNSTLEFTHQNHKSHDKHLMTLKNHELHLLLPTPTALHSLASSSDDYNDHHESIETNIDDNDDDIEDHVTEKSKKLVLLNDNLIVENLLTTSIVPLLINEYNLIETTSAAATAINSNGGKTTTPTTPSINVGGDTEEVDRGDEKLVSSVMGGVVEMTATTPMSSTVMHPTLLTTTLSVHTKPKQGEQIILKKIKMLAVLFAK